MREGPYVRPNLAATRDGVPDPAIEVEVWLDRLETILASEGPDWSAHGAYDLLAGWAKLKRARADLIHSLGAGKELADAQRVLSKRGPDLAQLALTVPNPPAWREETVTLEACYERLIDPVERSSLAERLITDGAGRVVGVACRSLRDAPAWARLAHRVLHRWSVKPGVYLPSFGRALHRPSFMPAPAFALRLLLGEMADALLLSGQRALPAVAQRLGFTFKFANVDAALNEIFTH